MNRRPTLKRTAIRRMSGPARDVSGFEALEARKLLAASIIYDAAADTVNIYGGGNWDNALISWQSGGLNVSAWDSVSTNNKTVTGPVNEVRFYGNNGNDWVRNDTTIRLSAWGQGGNDQLIGGPGSDRLDGGSGTDTAWGLAGNDTLLGGYGNDQLAGGTGHDWLDGGDDHDHLWGEAGADSLFGSNGNDTLEGGSGHDLLLGGHGDDAIYGGTENDRLNGGLGRDWLFGNEGDDTLVAIDNLFTDYVDSGSGYDTAWINSSGQADTVLGATSADKTHAVGGFSNWADLTLDGDRIADPSAGSYGYRTFGGLKLFSSSGPTSTDVRQGQTGDCYFMAALGSAALEQPLVIRQNIVDFNDGTFGVKLGGKFYRVDNDLPVDGNNYVVNASLGAESSGWVALYEKAFAHHRTGQNSYASLNNGWSNEAFTALGMTNAQHSTSSFNSAAYLATWIRDSLATGTALTVTSLATMSGYPLVENHVYMVTGSIANAWGTITHIILRNPWGTDGGNLRDGVNDGVVTVSTTELFAWTRMVEWGRR